MDALALLVAFALLAIGFYRLWNERRPGTRTSASADPNANTNANTNTNSGSGSGSGSGERVRGIPSLVEDNDDEDITIVTLAPVLPGSASPKAECAVAAPAQAQAPQAVALAPVDDDDDEEAVAPSAVPIVYDDDARLDEPTRNAPWILVSAAAQTDQGRRRRRNEDSFLALEELHLFVVADGMGGHAGGDVASRMAVDVIADAFKREHFAGEASVDGSPSSPGFEIPRRGAELAIAIQMANKAIYEHARANAAYKGMGTTVVSARFSPNKQRVYLGHVGDSRCYRLRAGLLTQITTDHTMAAQGITGPLASHLNRAVGIQSGVKVDLIIAKPRPGDVYLLCSDGLSKMIDDDHIRAVLAEHAEVEDQVRVLVDQANEHGGRDNITVVVVHVKDAAGVAELIQAQAAKAAASSDAATGAASSPRPGRARAD